MGAGGGCVIQDISLKAYQKMVGPNVMTVDTNTDTYTFVSSHTIKCYNIEFAKNDKLLIQKGVNVTLEGTLTIEEETVGIDRIAVNGSLTIKKEAAITFGAITNGKGIVVNSNNSVTLESGSSITINSLISTGDGEAYGLLVGGENDGDSGAFTQEQGSVMTIGDIKNEGGGSAVGVIVVGVDSTFTQHGEIIIGGVTYTGGGNGYAYGVVVLGGRFTQNGSITINNVTNEGVISGVGSVLARALGVAVLDNSKFTQEQGSVMTINNVTNEGVDSAAWGVGVLDNSKFTQEQGSVMTITGVTNEGEGEGIAAGLLVVSPGSSFNAKNLTVSGVGVSNDGSFGIVSFVEGGVVNSGSVRVYSIKIKYSSDGTNETDPSPINNTGSEDDNKFFTGQTYDETQ